MIPNVKAGVNQRNTSYAEMQNISQDSLSGENSTSYIFLVDEENFGELAKQSKCLIVPQIEDSELIFNFNNVKFTIRRKCTTKKK